MRSRGAHRCLAAAALAALLWSPSPAGSGRALAAPPDWKDVDQLVAEQKLESAAAAVVQLREAAEKAGDETTWARALVREAQLRTQLGGYETAVRLLRTQRWPKGTLARAALRLFQAATLVNYGVMNAWEIGQRERVATASATDLKAWTQDQIFAAATAAYVEVWQAREALGGEPGLPSVRLLAAIVEAQGLFGRISEA